MIVADLDALAAELAPIARVSRRAASAPLTTYRVGGEIGLLVEVDSPEDLTAVSAVLRGRGARCAVIGRGSNLLVTDSGFDGVVLRLGMGFESVECHRGEARVHAGGAVPLPVLARQSALAGQRGLEFFVGIPGTVGGAVRMNAGGHGAETVDVLETASVLTLGADAPDVLGVGELGFGFRRSSLRDDQIVVRATFRAEPGDAVAARDEIETIVRWRRANQPGGQNCGSVFVNPDGDAAGRLIEECGLKSARVGGAVVSDKHANFIQAEPGARASDVVALIALVRRAVAERTGVELRTELRVLGDDPPDAARGLPA